MSPQVVVYAYCPKLEPLHIISFTSCPEPTSLQIIVTLIASSYKIYKQTPIKLNASPKKTPNKHKPCKTKWFTTKGNKTIFLKKIIHIKHFTHLSKWSRIKNSKAKFIVDETYPILARVVSVKEVFLLLPRFLLIEVLHWGINVMDMYFLFNLFII